MAMQKVKCVLVGDGGVGKTCMLISYSTDCFPIKYVPTVFDNYEAHVAVDGCLTGLTLLDTAGQEEYDHLRPLGYPDTDVFIICYSVISHTSLENVRARWIPEVQLHCPDAEILLVGNKTDMRKYLPVSACKNLRDKSIVSSFVGPVRKGRELGVMECSAKTQEGLKEVFDVAIRLALLNRKPKKTRNKCVLL